MSIWNTLGIDPTTDKRRIKRAYAKMAAKYHPEEQPEKFKEVYDAYEQAISYAEGNSQTEFHFQEAVDSNRGIIKTEQESRLEQESKLVQEPKLQQIWNLKQESKPEHFVQPDDEASLLDFEGIVPPSEKTHPDFKNTHKDEGIDFKKIPSGDERKLTLRQEIEPTIDFQSIVKDELENEQPYEIEYEKYGKPDKKKERMKTWICVGVGMFLFGILQLFSIGLHSDNEDKRLSGQEQVKHILEQKYDIDFFVAPIKQPEDSIEIYYLIKNGKSAEDYQWFECYTLDARVDVEFCVALDNSGTIHYNYAGKELLVMINNAGLGTFLDEAAIREANLEFMKKGEKRYCYPILKVPPGNINADFFEQLGVLADMIKHSEAQFAKKKQLTINLKNPDNGLVYNLHFKKGKGADMEAIKQEVMAFYGK